MEGGTLESSALLWQGGGGGFLDTHRTASLEYSAAETRDKVAGKNDSWKLFWPPRGQQSSVHSHLHPCHTLFLPLFLSLSSPLFLPPPPHILRNLRNGIYNKGREIVITHILCYCASKDVQELVTHFHPGRECWNGQESSLQIILYPQNMCTNSGTVVQNYYPTAGEAAVGRLQVQDQPGQHRLTYILGPCLKSKNDLLTLKILPMQKRHL